MTALPRLPGRRDPRRREELLAAAETVVMRDGPGATMATIAAEAGITKPVLYRHFGDKGGLYAALAERHTEQLLEGLSAALAVRGRRARTRATIDRYLQLVEERPQVYRFLMRSGEAASDPAVRGQIASFLRRLTEVLTAGMVAELRLSAEERTTAEVWSHGIVGAVQNAGDWWLETRTLPREELADCLTELLAGTYITGPDPDEADGGSPGER